MALAFLREVFQRHEGEDFLIWKDQATTYGELLAALDTWAARLEAAGVPAGAVVAMEADYTPSAVAALLALVERGCIAVPLSRAVAARKQQLLDIAETEYEISLGANDPPGDGSTATSAQGASPAQILPRQAVASHDFYRTLRERGHAGLVVFSSGSTGDPKGAVHDFEPILDKFRVPRHRLRTLLFLLFDHLGGLNTLLYSLSNGGCCVAVSERGPDEVLGAVARHRVELLPTSPTFLNLMLLGEAQRRHDLSSLRTISYGTEPMPESTLHRLREAFPQVRLLQTYGLSEIGVMRSQSRDSGSLWVKVGGEGFETRVVDGLLEVQAHSAMLGYLNAPSPFTADGWFMTGDEVEVDGEWLRILGRKSELINVGGQKVYPAEVESVLLEMDEIRDAAVHAERNPLLGQVVCARIAPVDGADPEGLAARARLHCRQRLEKFKVPVKVEVVESLEYQGRFKKSRRAPS